MKRLTYIILPLAALLASLLGAPSAAAGYSDLTPWRTASCATGAMTAHSSPGRFVWVTGWIEPCPGSPAPSISRYAIIYFGPEGGAPGRPLHYDGPTGRTSFEGQLYTKRPDSLPVAACLAFSPTGRLSCVSIAVGEVPGLLVVTPIPTDDPRVTVPVLPLIGADDAVTSPHCGTCL